MSKDRGWLDIATAPKEGNFLIAAWHWRSGAGAWVIGEAYRDRDEQEKFWWANTSVGDYHADDLISGGFMPALWQPMPAPPAKPYEAPQ